MPGPPAPGRSPRPGPPWQDRDRDHRPHAVPRPARRLVTELADAGLDPRKVYDDVVAALDEDLPGDDVTTEATVPADSVAWADFVARADGTVAGTAVAELVLRFVAGDDLRVERRVRDGEPGRPRRRRAERCTARSACCSPPSAPRSTTWATCPGSPPPPRLGPRPRRHRRAGARHPQDRPACGPWRSTPCAAAAASTTAARCPDQALVKDNHVLAAGGVVPAYEAVRRRYPTVPVQVEVTDARPAPRAARRPGADRILLDNMDSTRCAEAVAVNAGRAELEASGGLTLERAREVAETGVDYLAVGALTHSAPRRSTSPWTCVGTRAGRGPAALRRHRQQPHHPRPARGRRRPRPLAGGHRRAPDRRRVGGADQEPARRLARCPGAARRRGLLDGPGGAARVARHAARATSATSRTSSSSPACAPGCRC